MLPNKPANRPLSGLPSQPNERTQRMPLSTHYLGFTLKNPLVASPSPPNAHLDHLRRLEDAGIAAVVLPSLFEEQIEADTSYQERILSAGVYNSPETTNYLPEQALDIAGPYHIGPDAYLDLVCRARAALAIPVIASLNGASDSGWIEYAKQIAQAGANALELNISIIPTDLTMSGADIEARHLAIVAAVRGEVELKIAVKLSPCLTAPGHLTLALEEKGANGVVLFNRIVQPDINPATLSLVEKIHLSTQEESQIPLMWTALLAGRTKLSLAASTGVETGRDVVKYLLAGADVVMTTSSLLRHGPLHAARLLSEVEDWMAARGFTSVAQVRGLLSWSRSRHRERYGRTSYLHLLGSGPGLWETAGAIG